MNIQDTFNKRKIMIELSKDKTLRDAILNYGLKPVTQREFWDRIRKYVNLYTGYGYSVKENYGIKVPTDLSFEKKDGKKQRICRYNLWHFIYLTNEDFNSRFERLKSYLYASEVPLR